MAWNEPVMAFGKRLDAQNAKAPRFHAIATSFLEFAQPDVAAGVEALEKAGCDRIIAVPLFIAPSSHSHFDVPAVLGLYSSPSIRATLAEEGARVASPRVPVTVTETLSEGDALAIYCRDEVRALSKDPKNEALVILAHGDPGHEKIVEEMMRRVASFTSGETGLRSVDWAYCAVGQTYLERAAPVIEKAAARGKRVLVVGLYLSSSAAVIHERAAKGAARGSSGEGEAGVALFEGRDIVFSARGVIHHPDLPQWIMDTAVAAIPESPTTGIPESAPGK